MKLVLEGERPVSWNKYYGGTHWSKRKADADAAHLLVRAALPRNARPYKQRVDITIRAYFRGKALDADNIVGKLYIDGLIGSVLYDDSPQYVRSVRTMSLRDHKRPRVEIEINPVKEDSRDR